VVGSSHLTRVLMLGGDESKDDMCDVESAGRFDKTKKYTQGQHKGLTGYGNPIHAPLQV
jgi:hypothetical protein